MKKLLLGILSVIIIGGVAVTPVFADNDDGGNCTLTSVLGGSKCRVDSHSGEVIKDEDNGTLNCSCDDGKGSSITHILNLVIDILTIGVGILGVIGITVVGIQYLTAGGNEEKTRKAKRRMFEIIIGLVAYVLIYAVLNWLVPNFRPFL